MDNSMNKKLETVNQICDMIDDIMSLQFSTIFEYLQAKVIKEAETKNLADFQSLIMK